MTRTSKNVTAAETSRRGRPPSADRSKHVRHVLDAAFDVLLERGFEKTSMLAIAKRAGASKETLYAWFGNRDGLFQALIEDNADRTMENVAKALDSESNPSETLTRFATGLLTLLTSKQSIVLNRSAMTSPALAEVLLSSGRHRVGPLIEKYLTDLSNRGQLKIDDSAEAFRTFYGLVVQDTQIRALLGEKPPSKSAITKRSASAVERFFAIYS